MKYKIEKGVPMPDDHQRGFTAALRLMAPGDSIVIEDRHQTSAHTSAKAAGFRIKTRREGDGFYRVWLVGKVGNA